MNELSTWDLSEVDDIVLLTSLDLSLNLDLPIRAKSLEIQVYLTVKSQYSEVIIMFFLLI